MKEIYLTKDQITVVDDEDYEWLNSFLWHTLEYTRHKWRGQYKAVELPDGKFIGWFNTFDEAATAKGLKCV